MKKRYLNLFLILILSFITIFTTKNTTVSAEGVYYLGGIPAGFELITRGATVVGLSDVLTEKGIVSPSKDAEIQTNDIILNIDTFEINTAFDIEKSLKNDKEKILTIKRNESIININVKPAKDLSGKFKLGVFIKNGINGIGTLTYIKKGEYGSLGHAVYYNNQIADIVGGNIYNCNITDFTKGEISKPGELKGILIKDKTIGNVLRNTKTGIYGTINENFNFNSLEKIQLGEGKIGQAYIYTTINGNKPQKYQISIVKTDYNDINNKNYVIKINDKRLLESTGGIVQGMSGSPIVQDGKLIGAVTHVFTNDPTRGFGIFINNMIVE